VSPHSLAGRPSTHTSDPAPCRIIKGGGIAALLLAAPSASVLEYRIDTSPDDMYYYGPVP